MLQVRVTRESGGVAGCREPPHADRFRTRFRDGQAVDPACCGEPSGKGSLSGQGGRAAEGRFMESPDTATTFYNPSLAFKAPVATCTPISLAVSKTHLPAAPKLDKA